VGGYRPDEIACRVAAGFTDVGQGDRGGAAGSFGCAQNSEPGSLKATTT